MEPNSDHCTKCGKPKTGTKGATITQWVSLCQCDALLSAKEAVGGEAEQIKSCKTCGKKIEQQRPGSLTQWIFKENSCRCALPVVETSHVQPRVTPHQVSLRRVEEPPVDDSSLRAEFASAVQAEFEPKAGRNNQTIIGAAIVAAFLLGVSLFAYLTVGILSSSKSETDVRTSNLKTKQSIELELSERHPPDLVGSVGLVLDGNKVVEAQQFMPARESQIQPGDRIQSIDGESVVSMDSRSIEQKLFGSCGTSVHISLLRSGHPLSFNLERDENIYENFPSKLTAPQYYNLGIQEKCKGRANRSRLAFTRAIEDGDEAIKAKARTQLKCELPKKYVSFEAQKMNNDAHNMFVSAAYKSFLVQSKNCIEKFPEFEWPYITRAMFYMLDDKDDKAQELLQKVAETNPDFTRAWILQSMLKERAGDKTAAKELMNRAVSLNQESLEERNNLKTIFSIVEKTFADSSYVREWKKSVRRRQR